MQAAQLKRAQDYADWQAKQQYTDTHPKPTQFQQDLQAAGIDPNSDRGRVLYQQRIQNDVDPIHAYPTTDANGNEGLIFKRPSEMGVQGMTAVQIKGADDYNALPPGTPYIDPNGQHRVKGGAPSQGGATFP